MKTHILVLGSFSALLMLSASNSISAADDSGNPPSQSDTVYEWYDSFKNKGQSNQDERTISVPEFPDTFFLWKNYTIYAVENGEESPLVSGMPIFSAYFTDLNGDGYPELCASVAFGSGIIDSHISVYDIHNQAEYYLWDRMVYDYTLEKADGQLIVHKQPYYIPYGDSYTGETGRLVLEDGCLIFDDGSSHDDKPLPQHISLENGETYQWFGKNSGIKGEEVLVIEQFPDYQFVHRDNMVFYEENHRKSSITYDMFNTFFCDMNEDGYPEICSTVCRNGFFDIHILDLYNTKGYSLFHTQEEPYSYVLYEDGGELLACRTHDVSNWSPDSLHGEYGRLDLQDELVFLPDSTLLPPHSGTPSVTGDVNNDGAFSIADIVLLQKWLLGSPNVELPNWKAADMCEDGILNVFDLCMMRAELNRTAPPVKRQITTDDIIELSRSGYSLTMADFAGFQGEDIGSGLYVMEYEVSGGKFRLLVGSGNCTDIIYANLEVVNGRQMTDIRDGDIEEFIVRFSE